MSFKAHLAAQGETLPSYVDQEFEAYLKCGRLEHGFLRVRCDSCQAEHLVAFSCKNRGFCPSCGARRMAESAALLVDEVFPEQPVRQKEDADILRLADHIYIEELYKHDLYDQTSQAFAVFLPVKVVGVMGDNRQYNWVIALRAVETIDFMTARWAHLPYEFLDHVSRRIVNEIPAVTRCVYDITGKPPGTIEWE